MDIAELRRLFAPSAEDESQARNTGLLQMGLGMLANNTEKNPWPAVGQGGLLGIKGYKEEADRLQKRKITEIEKTKLLREMEQQGALENFQKRVQAGEFTISPASQALALGGGPTVSNAVQMDTMRPKLDRSAMYTALAATPGGLPTGLAGLQTVEENALKREEHLSLLKMKQIEAKEARGERLSFEERRLKENNDRMREMQQNALENSRNIAALMASAKVDAANIGADTRRSIFEAQQANKPKMPASAMKLQNDQLEDLGIATGMQADLTAIKTQIETGKLPLGVISNALNTTKNAFSMSTQESRNLADFKAAMEKLRNDSLRLNKGTQTEGDATRAWNELFANINDPDVVKQRLGTIIKNNERAATTKKLNIDRLRSDFNAPQMDYSAYEKLPASIGLGTGNVSGAIGKTSSGTTTSNW